MQEMTILQDGSTSRSFGVFKLWMTFRPPAPILPASTSNNHPAQYQQPVYNACRRRLHARKCQLTSGYQPQASYRTLLSGNIIPNAVNSTIDTRAAISNGTPLPFAQAQVHHKWFWRCKHRHRWLDLLVRWEWIWAWAWELRCQSQGYGWRRAVTKLPICPGMHGRDTQPVRIMPLLLIRVNTQLLPGLTLDRFILTRKFRWDGVKFRSNGMTVGGC